jgi:mycofactocin precursor
VAPFLIELANRVRHNEREVLMDRQTEPATTTRGRSPVAVAPPASPDVPTAERAETDQDVVLDELLVEDVSIDGMCGVY